MSRHEIPAAFVPGAKVVIQLAYGPLLAGVVTKRTKTQVTTESAAGRTYRWVAGWGTAMNGDLQAYGTLGDRYHTGQKDRLMLADSPAVARERARRAEKKAANDFAVALDNARRHNRIEDLEALLALLPERLEAAKAAQAKAERIEAERLAVIAEIDARRAARQAALNA